MSLREVVLCLALCVVLFALSLFLQRLWISWMRRLKIGQAIKKYGPAAHMKKAGTPNMGGVVALFVLPFAVACAAFVGLADFKDLAGLWLYPVLAAMVGLLDDGLKFRSNSSEGLRSLQKLLLQIVVTLPLAIWVAARGVSLLPGWELRALYAVPFLLFLGVGIQNAVNVTDGLDGLAGGAVAISLVAVLLLFRTNAVIVSAAVGLAILMAFLWHNANPAALFMGDVGAHLWGGFLISICVAADSLLLIFPIAFLFGIEMVTVTMQIVAIRRFGCKIFKMSPLHHHFELSGWGETKIVTRFWLAHTVGMAALLAIIFFAREGGV